MLPKWHILIGFVVSYILVYFFDFSLFAGLTIFISSWLLIDLDHYFRYVFITCNISLIGFWRWSMIQHKKYESLSNEEKKNMEKPIFIFHCIEFWIALVLLGFISPFFFLVLIGVGVHMASDWTDMIMRKEPIYIKLSIMHSYFRNKKIRLSS